MSERTRDGGKLPWTYWPIAFAALVFWMVLGAVICGACGINPYVAAAVVGGIFVLRETYTVARRGR